MDKRILELVNEEDLWRRRQVRNLVILALAVAVALGGLVYAVGEVARSQRADKVVIDPKSLPPIRPGGGS